MNTGESHTRRDTFLIRARPVPAHLGPVAVALGPQWSLRQFPLRRQNQFQGAPSPKLPYTVRNEISRFPWTSGATSSFPMPDHGHAAQQTPSVR